MILWTIALLAISIMTTSSVNPGYDEFGNENSDNIRDVGWFLDFNYHGIGYGSEAARAMIDYMFKEVQIDKIETCAATDNLASWKIMEKLGFHRTNKIKKVKYTILTEEVPYVVGDKLTEYEQERGMIFNYSNYSETLLNHLLKSLSLSMSSMGRHNLPLMGGGDWNDGMNKVGIKGSGESVWLGFFLYQIIAEFISFMKEYDSNFDTIKYPRRPEP